MELDYNPMSMRGKAVLVTGASSGIGKAIAIECSKLGAFVICTGRNEKRLQETYSMLNGNGHKYIVTDFEDQDSINSLVEQLPKLDGISHNVGIGGTSVCSRISRDNMLRLFEVNAFSLVEFQSKLIKKRKLNNGGSIVIMSSLASKAASIGNAIYGMTKSAIECYGRYLAKELATKKIRVNSIHPGMVVTPLIENSAVYSQEDYDIDIKKNYPLGRYGTPADIAHLAAFLLSDASVWMTGENILIDGGSMLR